MTIALISFLIVIIMQAVIIFRQNRKIWVLNSTLDHIANRIADHYKKTGQMVDIGMDEGSRHG